MNTDLFDHSALQLHRARDGQAVFLHEVAIEEISARLMEVNKTFTSIAIVGPQARFWAKLLNVEANCIADADVLDLQEKSYDLIIHALSLHWANDPVGQLVQMRRALQPDGLMLAAMFGGDTLQELRRAFGEAEVEVEGGLSPRVAPMGEIRDLGGLLQRAGFALPVADTMPLTVDYSDALALCRDLRAMGETNALLTRRKSMLRRDTLFRMVELYQQHFGRNDGRVLATFEIVFLTGWAPADTQQKPLRPGSAKMRLADALKVTEEPLPLDTPRQSDA